MQDLVQMILPILEGSKVTLQLFAITLLLSIPLGLCIALLQRSKSRILKKSMEFYVWVMRGTPLLLQLFFIYFGLPSLGISVDRFLAAVIAFSLNYAAYFSEIFRAGIDSVDRGQFEAAYALGFSSFQTMRYIILPQMTRNVLPPVSNEVISLVKDTSLIYAIGLSELLREAKLIVTRDFTIMPFVIAAIVYLVLTYVITKVFRMLEKRFAYMQP